MNPQKCTNIAYILRRITYFNIKNILKIIIIHTVNIPRCGIADDNLLLLNYSQR